MALARLWTIAWRDLGRHKRRTFFSIVAVALGLGLLIVLDGWIAGMVDGALQTSIRFETGHVQLRAASYDAEKATLQWKDLLAEPDQLAVQAQALPEVAAAAPVLWASGVLNTRDESTGLKLYGIDTASAVYDPFRAALVAGEWLAPDDRSGILIGKRLADSLGIQVGDRVNLAIVNANGEPDETSFNVRGLFSTGYFTYDDASVLMPLARARTYTGTEGHASAIFILLHNQGDAERVAAALQSPGVAALSYTKLNELFLQLMQSALGFYILIYGIVILIVAVIVANTLLMAVFERIREMGILASLGMRGRQIAVMFLLEAAALGLVGILGGLVIGTAGVAYLANIGVSIGDIGSAAGNIPIGSTVYGGFDPGGMVSLSFWTLVITLLAALYPAWYAARLEPVEALRAL